MQISTQFNEEEKRLRYLKTIQLPLEPILEEPAIHFLISLPNGNKLKRKFHPSETLQMIKNFIDVQALEENGSQQIPTNYIILTDFPRKIWNDMSAKLEDLGFQKHVAIKIESI